MEFAQEQTVENSEAISCLDVNQEEDVNMEMASLTIEEQNPKDLKLKQLYNMRKAEMRQQIRQMRSQMQGFSVEDCDDDPLAMFSSYKGPNQK